MAGRAMSSLFLFGDVRENFPALSEPFVRASGGRRAKVTVLMLPGSKSCEARYRDALLESSAGRVTSIYPPQSLVLDRSQPRTLSRSTGILMAGGNPAMYQRSYGTTTVSRLIRELYDSGVP